MRAGGFYLGTHEPSWLRRDDVRVPLFVWWACDSGGFSEIAEFGRWTLTARNYADELMRYRDAIGSLDWAAPQDWMCEPVMLAKTGMTVAEHQARTTLSVLELRRLLSGEAVPIVPVLQGWRLDDYLRHVEQYRTAGVDLTAEPLVGLGSVCRRQALGEATAIVQALAALGIKLHGFGMKGEGLALYGAQLETADSMAWSYAGRRRPDPDCPAGNVSCANCLHYALSWRESALTGRQADAGVQDALPLRWSAA